MLYVYVCVCVCICNTYMSVYVAIIIKEQETINLKVSGKNIGGLLGWHVGRKGKGKSIIILFQLKYIKIS